MLENYLVVGLGITGLSVIEYLCSKNLAVIVTDSREAPPQLAECQAKFPTVEVLLGAIVVPENITHIILSPGLPLTTPEIQTAIQRGVEVIGDIELFVRATDKPIIAITGSNGKSTTTSLLGAMAAASGVVAGVGGNLGTPVLKLLDPKCTCYILELSSFQLETTYSLHAQAATVLNISPDHMDRYADVAAYTDAKLRIYTNAAAAVVNRQDFLTSVPDNVSVPKVISFGLDTPTDGNYGVMLQNNEPWLAKGSTPLLPVNAMAMLGAHNVANALTALALGEIAGFKLDAMLATLKTFAGLEHRCEKVTLANKVLWVNDSKGTNVGATLAAIDGLADSISGKWVIILGGVGKNADFNPLVAPIAKYCKAAILIGEDAKILWDLLHNVLPCFMAADLGQVVEIALLETQPNDGVLLSPACASLDMFNNYMHRGEVFKQQVLQKAGCSHLYERTSDVS